MRVLRIAVGIVTLLMAIPVLLTGGLAWWVMQHRSPDGAFQAQLAPIDFADPAGATSSSSSRVVVVPDVDALLRRDAPFTRADRTVLRLTADGAFFGLARPADVAQYLAGVGYTEIQQARPARGPLPMVTAGHAGAGDAQLLSPHRQDFWVQHGSGELSWEPASQRGRQLALVVIPAAVPAELAAPAGSAAPLRLTASVTAGWLSSTTWGLLSLGPVLLLLGFVILAWPQRPREVVYVLGDRYQPGTVPYVPAVTPYAARAAVAVAPEPAPAAPAPPAASAPPAAPTAPAPRAEADPAGSPGPSGWPVATEPETAPAQELAEEDDRPMPIAGLRFTR